MKLLYLSLFTVGLVDAFQPADRAALKTAVDTCTTTNGDGTGSDHAGDGSKCYACLDGTIVATASTTCTDASTPTFITNWDTSLVTNMQDMMNGKASFNQALNWDTSSVTKMVQMFRGTTIFNQDISAFDTSKVTDFSYMFYISGFNQDISSWDVSGGTKFNAMFRETSAFNQDISSWDMSSALRLDNMFRGSPAPAATNKFNQDISAWDTSSVTKMNYMFNRCEFDQDISCWDIAAVTTFDGMFYQGYMTKTLCWDTSGGTTDSSFLESGGGSFDSTCTASCSSTCAENEHVSSGACTACAAGKVRPAGDDPAGADTACKTPAFQPADRAALKSAVDACVDTTTKDGSECYACLDGTMKTSAVACTAGDTAQFISDWDTSLVTDMNALFKSKRKFNTDIGAWDTSSVTTFSEMFANAYEYNNGNELLNWDTSSVTAMNGLFQYTDFNQCLCGWDTSKVTTTRSMFYSNPTDIDKTQKFNQDISCWDVSSVTDMSYMFYENNHMAQTLCWDTGTAATGSMFQSSAGSVDSTCTSTGCILTACKENERVSGGTCVACLAEEINDAGDDWLGADTTCTQWCAVNKKVVAGVCTACPVGSSSDGGLVTECTWTCNANEKVESGACVACPAGEVSVGGSVTTCSKAVFKPADRAALKTAVDACVDATKDGSECYACVDGEVHDSASGTCTDGSTPTFISKWDTSLVTDMSSVFSSKKVFNQDISRWDVSSVTTFYNMFYSAEKFEQDLSCWDISAATTVARMFMYSKMHYAWWGASLDITLCWDTAGKTTTSFLAQIDSCTPTGCTALGLACSADDECNSGACDTTCYIPPPSIQCQHVLNNCPAACTAGCWDSGSTIEVPVTRCGDIYISGDDTTYPWCLDTTGCYPGSMSGDVGTIAADGWECLGSTDGTTWSNNGPPWMGTPPTLPCAQNEKVTSSACVACPAGKTNVAGDDPGGTDTMCDATLCAINQRVVSNDCVDCPADKVNVAGNDASGADTACIVDTTCAVNKKVVSGTCVACPSGKVNNKGDDPAGSDTKCYPPIQCQHILNSCPAACTAGCSLGGSTIEVPVTRCGDIYISGDDTTYPWCLDTTGCYPGSMSGDVGTIAADGWECLGSTDGTTWSNNGPPWMGTPPTLPCAQNEKVTSSACVACPAGKTNVAGDDPGGTDTMCDATLCAINQRVVSNDCVDCPADKVNVAGNDASGADTACIVDTTCAVNKKVVSGTCVACPSGKVNNKGDDPAGSDTKCYPPIQCQHILNSCPAACTAGCSLGGSTIEVPVTRCGDIYISGDDVAYPWCLDTAGCHPGSMSGDVGTIAANGWECLGSTDGTAWSNNGPPWVAAGCATIDCGDTKKSKDGAVVPDGKVAGPRYCCVPKTKGCKDDATAINHDASVDIHVVGMCLGKCEHGASSGGRCVCDAGWGGRVCDKETSASAKRNILAGARKNANPTPAQLKERQNVFKEYAKEILKEKMASAASKKDAVKESRFEVEAKDLSEKTQKMIEGLGKPMLAVAPENKDEDDTCHEGAASDNCVTFDLADDSSDGTTTIVSVESDNGSWSVLAEGATILSKQTRVSETVFDMQCWDVATGDWGTVTTIDVATGSSKYGCNGKVLLVASQAGVCTSQCGSHGTCSDDGEFYICECDAGWMGDHCDVVDTRSHCFQTDCTNYGGYKATAGGCDSAADTCKISDCCVFASQTAYNTACSNHVSSADYLSARCCDRSLC